MLGSYAGRIKNLKERLGKFKKDWFIVQKRLRNSLLSKKTQARVVEIYVESCALFDAEIRSWHKSEMKAIQSRIDRCYR
mgnify:CR=1 FL=1